MKGAQHARDGKTAPSPPPGPHRPGRVGGDRYRRVTDGHRGPGEDHGAGPARWRWQRAIHQQAVLREHGRALHGPGNPDLPLHPDQRQRHEDQAPDLRRHHPGHRPARRQRPGRGRGPRLQDPAGLRDLRQPAGHRQRRPLLRGDDRPVRQPDRQGYFHPEPAGRRPGHLHRAHQQRGEQPARRARRLRRPHLEDRQSHRHLPRSRSDPPAGQPQRGQQRRGRQPGLPTTRPTSTRSST
jgi:hypothetical protein